MRKSRSDLSDDLSPGSHQHGSFTTTKKLDDTSKQTRYFSSAKQIKEKKTID
jgi:hypothetical protein